MWNCFPAGRACTCCFKASLSSHSLTLSWHRVWKAGTAIFTLFNVFARISVSSCKRKTASDWNLEFSHSFRECFEGSWNLCSQFPLKPVASSSCSVYRELQESQRNGTRREFTCVWGMSFLSTPGATGWGRGCPSVPFGTCTAISTQFHAEFSLLEKDVP